MKKVAIVGAAALTLLDISASTPAEAQGASPFAGFYAGGHAGNFSAEATFKSAPYILSLPADDFPFAGRNDTFDIDGFLAGVHGGFNFVTPSNVLFGIEGDWSKLGEDDSVSASGGGVGLLNTDGFTFQRRSEVELDWQATIRGRVGIVNGNVLLFATAGVAFLDVTWTEQGRFTNTDTSQSFTVNHSANETLVGGVVGAGVDVAITPTIILGGDYLYENFESFDNVPHGFATGQIGQIDDLDVHKVRVRVSFSLGGLPQ